MYINVHNTYLMNVYMSQIPLNYEHLTKLKPDYQDATNRKQDRQIKIHFS